jgi:hypothetical protein
MLDAASMAGVSGGIMFERFTSEGLTDQPKELETPRVPVGVSFFHPSGLGTSVRATYYNPTPAAS